MLLCNSWHPSNSDWILRVVYTQNYVYFSHLNQKLWHVLKISTLKIHKLRANISMISSVAFLKSSPVLIAVCKFCVFFKDIFDMKFKEILPKGAWNILYRCKIISVLSDSCFAFCFHAVLAILFCAVPRLCYCKSSLGSWVVKTVFGNCSWFLVWLHFW